MLDRHVFLLDSLLIIIYFVVVVVDFSFSFAYFGIFHWCIHSQIHFPVSCNFYAFTSKQYGYVYMRSTPGPFF